ncbi:MAG: glycosyltransferase [Pseudomonadota bacterium]
MGTPDISIVTITWNSEKQIRRLLTSLLNVAKSDNKEIEVIVVDNASIDGTKTVVETFIASQKNIRFVSLNHNKGTTVSRNIGIRMSNAEHVLILDSDTQVPAGALTGLLESFGHIPSDNVAIVHPRLVYPDGSFQESARRFPTLFTKAYRLLRVETARSRDESIPGVLAGQITPVDYAISAAWLVPRWVFDEIGLLDERIFYSPEDVEFCARCWKQGYEVWYYPEIEIIHDCQRITAKRPLTRLGVSHARGLFRLWWEYDFLFKRPPWSKPGNS